MQESFPVERILQHRQANDTYLVEWEGYPASSNTWEVGVTLRQEIPTLIARFHETGRRLPWGRPPLVVAICIAAALPVLFCSLLDSG